MLLYGFLYFTHLFSCRFGIQQNTFGLTVK